MTEHRNREKDGVIVGLLIAVAGALMIVLPSLSEMDMMSGGYALIFVGVFILLSGLAVA